MRKIYAVTGAMLIAGMFACNRYLDVKPQGQIDEEAAADDPGSAQNLVTGVYNNMWLGKVHGFPFIGVTNIASDDADKGSFEDDAAPTQGQLDNLTMDANNTVFNDIWSGYYQAISRANRALQALESSTSLDQDMKSHLLGEAHFLRGYFYFNLVRIFGGVPKVDKVLTPPEAASDQYQTRAGADEIYQLIISDLEFALTNLPPKGGSGSQVGRATKGAAAGMLAKVFLYRQNWQRAYSLSDSVITGKVGSYSLADDYASIWRQSGANNAESIFEVQTGINATCDAAIEVYSNSQGPRAGGKGGWADLGWGFGGPSQSLVDEYEPGDKREAATIIFITRAGTVLWDGFRVPGKDSVQNDRYNYKAYHSRTREQFCGNLDRLPKNLRVLRLGEILLIHAEAALALGNANAAVADINALRERAGLTGKNSVTRADIWHERRVEMAMEHDRYFELVREDKLAPGTAAAAFRKHGKTFVAGKHEVFPIPFTQIQFSEGKLQQNPGY
ncbi:SusD family protein [Chitinophaga terrae (ex Kim and Jung 2007)]|uniref:SusD family protein n=1 Tax=Chitinophaga terrae (ex Kim and Jung 2007) TaxID=408074 RepID=A0A1H4D529_9BACT|nr:RagB/SusD family nutrient uptake outer membrane protein [Chitinophaga terrae (ex Kim and Jung 2007)]GEP90554.1 membrane protein [Chitinophaga terrae (ex Kim and Jung 2007)]SEA67646.1 SusD family protein [Chitinophaga terrae (ex Kim and Jung 2007)]